MKNFFYSQEDKKIINLDRVDFVEAKGKYLVFVFGEWSTQFQCYNEEVCVGMLKRLVDEFRNKNEAKK